MKVDCVIGLRSRREAGCISQRLLTEGPDGMFWPVCSLQDSYEYELAEKFGDRTIREGDRIRLSETKLAWLKANDKWEALGTDIGIVDDVSEDGEVIVAIFNDAITIPLGKNDAEKI